MACKNSETNHVPVEEDDGEDRTFWQIHQCPGHQDDLQLDTWIGRCSRPSWAKACCWSYQSETQVRCYLLQHLMHSGAHHLDPVVAEAVAQKVDVSCAIETFADREQYRKSLANQYARHAPSPSPPKTDPPETLLKGKVGKGKGKGQQKGESELAQQIKRTHEKVEKLTDTVQQIAKMSKVVSGARSSQEPMALQALPKSAPTTVPIALADLKMVGDSLTRASHACDQCENLCSKLAQQFSKEHQVLSEAKEIVTDLVRKHDAAASVRLL